MNINKTVASTGVFTTILVMILSYTLLKKKSSSNSCCIPLCIGLLFIAIFVFLSVDLKGQGSCKQVSSNPNTYKFVCKSKITKMNIPTYFCDKELFCECVQDTDCPASCNQCVNTICNSNPPRLGIMNQQQRPNTIFVVFSVLSALILGILIVNNYSHQLGVSKNSFIGIVIITIIVEMFVTYSYATKNYSSIIPVSGCA